VSRIDRIPRRNRNNDTAPDVSKSSNAAFRLFTTSDVIFINALPRNLSG
jgi:hypothetical protein